MGDEVWVEPKYITSMFGTWGSPSIVSFGWSAVFITTGISVGVTIPIPGHTPVSAGLITATTPIGYPYWGGYYPYWGYYPGWGGGHHHHPYPPHHRPNAVHRSTYRYGSGADSNDRIDPVRRARQGSLNNGYRNGTTVGSGSSGAAGPTAIPAPASEAAHRQSIEAARPTAILRSEAAAAPTGEAVRQRTEGLTPRPPRNRTEVRAAASWAEAEGSAAETAADVTLTAVKRSPGKFRRTAHRMHTQAANEYEATTGFDRQRRSFPPLLSRTPETKKQLNDFCYETSRNFGAAFSGLVRNRPGVGSKLRRFIDGP